jgi:hypothetical protein
MAPVNKDARSWIRVHALPGLYFRSEGSAGFEHPSNSGLCPHTDSEPALKRNASYVIPKVCGMARAI